MEAESLAEAHPQTDPETAVVAEAHHSTEEEHKVETVGAFSKKRAYSEISRSEVGETAQDCSGSKTSTKRLRLNDGSMVTKVVNVVDAQTDVLEAPLQPEQQPTEEAIVIPKAEPEEIAATLDPTDETKEADATEEATAELLDAPETAPKEELCSLAADQTSPAAETEETVKICPAEDNAEVLPEVEKFTEQA